MIKKLYIIQQLVILILFTSCKGQQNVESTNQRHTSIGKVVKELDKTIWDIHQDRDSNYWFGSKRNGVFCYNGTELRHFTKEDGLISNEIIGIQEDSTGSIFFETTEGVSRYDGESIKTLEVKKDPSLTQWKLSSRDLWFRIGFDKKGPYRYDGEFLYYHEFPTSPFEERFYQQNPNASFSPYGVYTIYKDDSGVMWFGTSGVGLCRYDGKNWQWHHEEQIQMTPEGGDFGMRSIVQDNDGFFWFNNSRYRYEILEDQPTNRLNFKKENGVGLEINKDEEYPYFLSASKGSDGALWMVTYSSGVWKNNGKELINYPVKRGSEDISLFSIYSDKNGRIWVGSHDDGVYYYNGNSFEKFSP